MNDQVSVPELYLVTPPLGDAQTMLRMIEPALDAVRISAVLLRLADADERTLINRVKALVPVAEAKGTALLLAGRPDLAARSGADGAHLTGFDALQAALPALKPDRIAGCGGLASRDDAMRAGEAGADYVMFGEPDASGHRPSFAAIAERIAWWAEVFQVPCVGYAQTLDEVDAIARARAEFVAVGDLVFADPRGPAAALADVAARLAAAEAIS
jgi:thiamine-phosphate pyrophosphorylase